MLSLLWGLFVGLLGALAFIAMLTLVFSIPEIIDWFERRRKR